MSATTDDDDDGSSTSSATHGKTSGYTKQWLPSLLPRSVSCLADGMGSLQPKWNKMILALLMSHISNAPFVKVKWKHDLFCACLAAHDRMQCCV